MDYEASITIAPDYQEEFVYIEDQFGKRVNTRTISSVSVNAIIIYHHIWAETFNLHNVMGGYSLTDIVQEVKLNAYL